MNFGQAISAGFLNYANFRGRASRSEFWFWALFNNILQIVAIAIDSMLNTELPIAVWVVMLATYIPTFAIGVRRLHDTDRSGWWILISCIPLIGLIFIFIWWATGGTDGPNRFGPDPLANPSSNQQFAPRIQGGTKKCPGCPETIRAGAKVCKYCGYDFEHSAQAAPQTEAQKKLPTTSDAPE
jgi:uncharacterized membrane protein YhaH (DUF805 family)